MRVEAVKLTRDHGVLLWSAHTKRVILLIFALVMYLPMLSSRWSVEEERSFTIRSLLSIWIAGSGLNRDMF